VAPWRPAEPPAEYSLTTPETPCDEIDVRVHEYLEDGFARLEAASYAGGEQFIDLILGEMRPAEHPLPRLGRVRSAGVIIRIANTYIVIMTLIARPE
jgi:hypothetical protein